MLPSASIFEQQINQQLPSSLRCEWLDETHSTNTLALEKLRSNPSSSNFIIGAHQQTSGRGRGGKKFTSAKGQQLLFTLGVKIKIETQLIPSLSIIVGILTCQTLRRYCKNTNQTQLQVKWPNDIWWNQAKLAGILIETVSFPKPTRAYAELGLAIGIGINIRGAQTLSHELQRPIAALENCIDDFTNCFSPAHLVTEICTHWYSLFNQTLNADTISTLLQQFRDYDALLGLAVDVTHDNQVLNSGIAQGIDAHGRLLVKTPTGSSAIIVGDISIKTL